MWIRQTMGGHLITGTLGHFSYSIRHSIYMLGMKEAFERVRTQTMCEL